MGLSRFSEDDTGRSDVKSTRSGAFEFSVDLERQLRDMMVQKRRRIFDSFPVFCGVATTAFALLGASTALATVDAVKLGEEVSFGAIAIAAAAVDAGALISIVVLTICRLGCSGIWFHRWVLPWTAALVAIAAAALSINALVLKSINNDKVKAVPNARSDVTTQFALWTVENIAQAVFYAFVMLRRLPNDQSAMTCSPPQEKKPAPPRPQSPPAALRLVAPHYALPQASIPLSSSQSFETDTKRSSWRDSLVSFQNAVRPNSSRTRLIPSRGASLSRDSSIRSTRTAQSDAFDSWDTSNVDLQLREAISPGIPSKGTALETIPGSRPVSPAKALDGPFPAFDDLPSKFLTMPTERPRTAQSSTSSRHDRLVKRTFVPASRPQSPADESHIHPLFRTDSPTPPPAVSRETSVLASPFSGTVMPAPVAMGPRPASRMRSNSRLSNRAISRASSIDELPAAADGRAEFPPLFAPAYASSPVATSPAASSLAVSRSRSSSPVSRKMTPPIPEFILSARREGVRSKSSRETLAPGTAL